LFDEGQQQQQQQQHHLIIIIIIINTAMIHCLLHTLVYCPNHNPMTGFSNADHASGMRSREDVDIKTALGTFRFRDPSLFESALFLTINSLFSFFFCSCSTFGHSQ
jgi:hypothetical protein